MGSGLSLLGKPLHLQRRMGPQHVTERGFEDRGKLGSKAVLFFSRVGGLGRFGLTNPWLKTSWKGGPSRRMSLLRRKKLSSAFPCPRGTDDHAR